MAKLKTKRNTADVETFLNGVENARRREDAFAVLELMREITGEPAEMWATASSASDPIITNMPAGVRRTGC